MGEDIVGRAVEAWLGEQEHYAIRAERVPEGAMPWIMEAAKVGAEAMAAEITRLRAALKQMTDSRDDWHEEAEAAQSRLSTIREEAAKIADAYADENQAIAGDTILHDPILSGGPATRTNLARSKEAMIDGCIHSSMYHAAKNIAAAIRAMDVTT